MDAQDLPGGRVTRPRRVDGRVERRPARPHPSALAALRRFEAAGWDGAPRLVTVAPDGLEILTFLPGRVPWQHPVPAWASTDDALADVARLVRQFHDLTSGTDLAGDAEVLCHNDLAPNNTVYSAAADAGQPYAFIDWDLAGPGRRIEDVAHVCWTWLDLGPGITDLGEAARQIRHILASYGAGFDLGDVLPVVAWWQHRCWRGIEAQAGAGDRAMAALVDDGTATAVRLAAQWTDAHRSELIAAPDHRPTDAP